MFLEQDERKAGLYRLVGTAEEFKDLRTVCFCAKDSGTSFSRHESTVKYEVCSQIYEQILEGQNVR